MSIIIKRNDTEVNLKATLSNESGTVDLTDCSVRFIMSRRGAVKVDKIALIQDQVTSKGLVWVVFGQGDTSEVGNFQAEFKVTFTDNRVETFPNDSYIPIEIKSDLAG